MAAAEALKSKRDIELLKIWLRQKKDLRYYLLFVIGINTGLRIGDILSLKVSHFVNEKGGLNKYLILNEEKTGKLRKIAINTAVHKALKSFLSHFKSELGEYIFSSRKVKNMPISKTQAYRVLNEAAQHCNISINFGTHTLRKTWSYHTYKTTGNNIGLVMELLNHSSQAVTLRYIGITQEQRDETYMTVEL